MTSNGWNASARAMLVSLALAGCARLAAPADETGTTSPSLPSAISNNAVAVAGNGEPRVYSFAGLLAGKTWKDVTNRAFEFEPGAHSWREIEPLPAGVGRLASTAKTVAGAIFIFGGYTVAEDGTEASTAEVYRFEPESGRYTSLPHMPVPVDDAISGVYRERFIYLVSGWHDSDNVGDS